MKLVKTLQLLYIVVSTTLITANSSAQKMYKWVDANGNISYQEQEPPANAKILDEIDVGTTKTKRLANISNTRQIKIYTAEECPSCVLSVQLLTKLNVPYVELPLENDRKAQSMILERTSSLVLPTILIGEDMLQAPSNDALTEAVKKAGYSVDQ